jgi:nucleoside-diphosphate-sugar epimerase
MRVALTGGTGFIGSHAIRALVAADHDVRLLVRDPAKLERLRSSYGLPVLEHVVGDMTDAGAVAALVEDTDAVVHAAATVAFEADRIASMHDDNLRGVETVLGAALASRARSIVYLSSVSAIFRPGYPPLTIDAPVATPTNPYGAAKADAERLARRMQAESDGRLSIVYPPGVVGPEDPALSESNRALLIYVRDFVPRTTSGMSLVDVRDLAALIVRALEEGGAERYLVSGIQLSWDEIAATIARVTGRSVKRRRLPGALLRAAGRLFDMLEAVAPLDWPLTYETMTYATQWPGIVESPAVARLRLPTRAAEQTFGDVIRWMHETGHVSARARGVLPPWTS